MPLAKASKLENDGKLRWPLGLAVIAFGVLGMVLPARSECLSPSAASGTTTTTVYRCAEENAAGPQSPIIVDPGKTTEVERGSADLPWFEPKPTKTADPITTSKAPQDAKEDAVQGSPAPVEAAKPATAKVEAAPTDAPAAKEVEANPTDEPSTMKADTSPTDTPAADVTRKKTTKHKAAVTKPVTAKPVVTKPVVAKPAKTKLAKAKRNKTKVAKEKRAKTKIAKAQPAPETAKTEPAKDDGKVVVWTKKDMSVGSRIVNWLGF